MVTNVTNPSWVSSHDRSTSQKKGKERMFKDNGAEKRWEPTSIARLKEDSETNF